MKLYLKNGNVFNMDNDLQLEILNLDEFISILNNSAKNMPAPHFVATLKYKLIDKNNEYFGESIFDSYSSILHGIKNNIDENCPYIVKLENWQLSDNDDKYLEFIVSNKIREMEDLEDKK